MSDRSSFLAEIRSFRRDAPEEKKEEDMTPEELAEHLRKKLAAADRKKQLLARDLLARQQSSQRHKDDKKRLASEISAKEQELAEAGPVDGNANLWPETWEPQDEMCIVVELKDGDEKEHVESIFKREGDEDPGKVFPPCDILKIERIQNRHLWRLYAAERDRLTIKNKDGPNEQVMFHGTRRVNPALIYNSQRGFDHGKSSRGMWGSGIYFSEHAKFVHAAGYKHSVDHKVKQILVCNVLVGEEKYYGTSSQNNLRRPPEKEAFVAGKLHEFYDSVTADLSASCGGNPGKMCIVYDNCCCVPLYIVTYQLK